MRHGRRGTWTREMGHVQGTREHQMCTRPTWTWIMGHGSWYMAHGTWDTADGRGEHDNEIYGVPLKS